MKTKIVIGIIFSSTILLLSPSISAIQPLSIDPTTESATYLKTSISPYVDTISNDEPPPWFTIFYTIIILSLNARILLITPLAITPGGEYWGDFEIQSYFFTLILMTLVYRFAFWYTLFDKIIEKNNWDPS